MPTRGPSGKGDSNPPSHSGGSPGSTNKTPSLGDLGSYRGTPERLADLSHIAARESQHASYRRVERFSQRLLQQAYSLSSELHGSEYETVGKNALLAAQKVYQDARVAAQASRKSREVSAIYNKTKSKEDLQAKIEQAKLADNLRNAHERSSRNASMLFRMIAQKGVNNVGRDESKDSNWYRSYAEQLKRNSVSASQRIASTTPVGPGGFGSNLGGGAIGSSIANMGGAASGGGAGGGGGIAPPDAPDDPDDFDDSDDSDDPDMRRRKSLLRRRRKAKRRREARKQAQRANQEKTQKRQAAMSLRYQKMQASKQYGYRRKIMGKQRSRRKANRRREQRHVAKEKKQASLYLRQQKTREKNQYSRRRQVMSKLRTRRKANRRRTERHGAREKRQASLYLRQQKAREKNQYSRRRQLMSRKRTRRKATRRREQRQAVAYQKQQRLGRIKTLASMGIASYAGHQAASGNFMGAASTLAWGTGNPYAIAITEFAHVTLMAVKGLKQFAENTFEANKRLSTYSGVISNAYGNFKVHEILRDYSYASGTQTTAKDLVVSMDKMRDAWQKINISTGNAFNTVSSLVAGGYASFGAGLTPGYTKSVDLFTGLAKSKLVGTDTTPSDISDKAFSFAGGFASEIIKWMTFVPRMGIGGLRSMGILGPAPRVEPGEEPAHLRFMKEIMTTHVMPPDRRLTAGMRGTEPPRWAGRR